MLKIGIPLVIVIALVAGGWYLQTSRVAPPAEMMEMMEQKPSADDTMMDETMASPAAMPAQFRYLTYSDTVLSETAGTRQVLFFYANWCPTCKQAETEINQNLDAIPEDVSLIRVNYNDGETDADEKALAKKYDITYQHTFVLIDQNGQALKKWNGGSFNEILNNLK